MIRKRILNIKKIMRFYFLVYKNIIKSTIFFIPCLMMKI